MIACNPAGGAIGFDVFETVFFSIFFPTKMIFVLFKIGSSFQQNRIHVIKTQRILTMKSGFLDEVKKVNKNNKPYIH